MISDVTATSTEINDTLDGTTATAANLNTLTAGSSSNADALHTHEDTAISFVAGESITEDDAVCIISVEAEYFSTLDDEAANQEIALGDSNVRRRYAVKFTPSQVPSFTTLCFRGREVATSVLNLQMTIETDAAGEPSGTAVTNGTAASLSTGGWTTSFGTRTATFPGVPTMVAGTDYWLVWEVDATDAVNYIELSTNADFDDNYLTFTRLTYSLDTATWGSSVTNATPYFWTLSTPKALGMVVVPTDANFGGRTWGFVGFAQSTVAADASVNVSTKIYDGLTGLTPGSSYFISTTAGEVTTTPPSPTGSDGTMRYKIGRAYNSTNLEVSLGEKKTWHAVGVAATTTYPIITWFRPLEVQAVNGSAGAGQYWGGQGSGQYDGTTNRYYSAASSSTQSLLYNSNRGDGGGVYNTGTGTLVSDVGFTVSNTNSSGTTVVFFTMIG